MTNPPYSSYPTQSPMPPSPYATRNTAGTISLVLGIVLLVWHLVQMFWQATTIASASPSDLGIVSMVNLVVVFVLAVAGLGFGIAGILAPGKTKVVAGIGTGLGISGVVNAVSILIFPVIIGLFAG